MKIVLIGGTGKIGTRMAPRLRALGHEVVIASRSTGVDAMTGKGLDVLADADAVVETTNPPSLDGETSMRFFRTTTGKVLAAAGGVRHYVLLSVVGADGLTESGYLGAKAAQEELVRGSGVPYTIVRATQFFDFVATIGLAALDGDVVRLPPILFRPIATADVAEAMVTTVLAEPRNGIVDIAGPEEFRLDELVAEVDPHKVIADPSATYFGAAAGERALLPSQEAVFYPTRFADWHQALTAPVRQET